MAKLAVKKNKKIVKASPAIESVDWFDVFELPVDKLFEVIINTAVTELAQAIHFEYSANGGSVRLRHHGSLHEVYHFDRTHFVELLKFALTYFDFDQAAKLPQLGRSEYRALGHMVHLNASWIKLSNFESRLVVMINPEFKQDIHSLSLNKYNESLLRRYLAKNHLATIVACRRSEQRKDFLFALALDSLTAGQRIVSVEQYITKSVAAIEQMQLKPEIGFTNETALRAIIAQDYDVVIIEEIGSAIELTLALHLVLAGKRLFIGFINDGLNDIFRAIRHFNVDFDLAFSAIGGILVAREIRQLCQRCSADIKVNDQVMNSISQEISNMPPLARKKYGKEISSNWKLKKSCGCVQCHGGGFSGVATVSEFALMSAKIKKALKNNSGILRLVDLIEEQSLVDLRQDALLRAIKGEIAINDAMNLDKYI